MKKIVWVAWREFIATVATKGFILGVLITPVIIGVMIVVMPILINDKPPKVDGEVAVVDPGGDVVAELEAFLQPAAIAERWDERVEEALDEAPEAVRTLTAASGGEAATRQALDVMLGDVPVIRVTRLPDGSDLEAEKQRLLEGSATEGGLLALVALHDDAVQREAGAEAWGTYDLFVREKLDDRLEDEIKRGMYQALVGARARAAGLDPGEVTALTRVGRIQSRTVTEGGEKATNEIFNTLLPAGFMVLLLVSVLSGGQYLMTTVVEEKSSRVVEVLLSAVSPMQLMTGKILGQMTVGLVILALYAGMGIAALVSFAMLGLVEMKLFVYLVIFFLIAYMVLGSLMAAIGAAVNEMREAQTLMTPVVVTMMVPWLLWMPISRDPNSWFAIVTSFLPPINPFVMLIRMTSNNPPPDWQAWLSIAIGAASVYGALWFASKVFRIGLLMYGKPPSFGTLVRWVRMA